ncbi:protein disulfide-isomerase precursor, partial [Massospora cicadina]
VITRLVFTLLFAAGFRGEEASVSNVLELTADNFKSTIEENKVIMVEFFAPWCGHCKKLAPHYDKAAAELTNTSIKLAKVDCTVHKSICEENGVRGFPTLKVFK